MSHYQDDPAHVPYDRYGMTENQDDFYQPYEVKLSPTHCRRHCVREEDGKMVQWDGTGWCLCKPNVWPEGLPMPPAMTGYAPEPEPWWEVDPLPEPGLGALLCGLLLLGWLRRFRQ